MKIAFCYIGAEVLGIEFLSATLKQHGHDVRLFLGGLVHRDWEPVLFAKYYVTYVCRAVLIKLGLKGYRKGEA